MMYEINLLIGFLVFISIILTVDLLLVGRKSHEISLKEATIWSFIWISMALGFALLLLYHGEKIHGISNLDELKEKIIKFAPSFKLVGDSYSENIIAYRRFLTVNYLSGYFIEKTLSIDNLFVMMAILSAFSVNPKNYKPVLFWGIFGAIILRLVFIFAGVAIIRKFEWILYIFGAYLVFAGVKMYLQRNKDEKIEPKNHWLFKFLSKRFNVFPQYVNDKFIIRKKGKLFITPLFVVLIFIEFSDIIFATDSVPAIFSITRDPYIVFFSNIFAILGLRALFFLLVHAVKLFHFLKTGISILLCFVGVKLLMKEWLIELGYKPVYSLYFILAVLVGSVVLSLLIPVKEEKVT